MRKTALPKQPTKTIKELESELKAANETIRTTESGLRKLSDEVAASREAVQTARRETEALLDAKDKEIDTARNSCSTWQSKWNVQKNLADARQIEIERLEGATLSLNKDVDRLTRELKDSRDRNESQFQQGRQVQRKETRELLGKESVAIQKHLDGQRFGERWADFVTGYGYLKLYMDGKFNQLVQAHLEPREPRPKDANEVEYPRFERVRKEEFN